MEQDRTSSVFFHQPELAWQTSDQPRGDCQPHCRHYYDRRLDDPGNFHLVLAAERFRPDELAEVIVAAAAPAATAAPDGVRPLLVRSPA